MLDLPISPLQREAATLIAENNGGIAWWRVGQGKTRIAMAAFILFPFKSVTSQFVVFARPEAFDDWRNDAEVMGIADRLVLKSYAMLSQQSAPATVADFSRLGNDIGMVCFDELYLFKNPKSIRSQMAHKIARVKPCIGLSGSIMTAQRLEDVYGQAWAVNKHARISPSLTRFREEYLIGINEFGGTRWTPKRGAVASLMSACSSFAHVYMPKHSERAIRESIVHVDVTSQQEAMFKELQDTLSLSEQNIELTSAASLIVKVQQVSDGWVQGHAPDEIDSYITPVTSNKPKTCIAKCEELVAAGERVLVYCAFRYDVEMLCSMSIGKFNYQSMLGGEKFDIERWKKGGQVCFATEAMGSSVNHFAQVKYAIYFSLSQKWLDMQQSMGRIDRKNSEHDECHYLFMCTKGSMDENVLRRVRHAGSSEKGMLGLAHDMREWLNGNVTSQN